MRLYLDSNVFIAYVLEEMDKAFNVRFMESERFFVACAQKSVELVISRHFLNEVEKIVSLKENHVREVFKELNVRVVFVENASEEKVVQIFQDSGIHFQDAIHAANAVESRCDGIRKISEKLENGPIA